MKRYTQDALNTLKEARIANPNVSQRKMARNIDELVEFDFRGNDTSSALYSKASGDLYNALGQPTNGAIQHLIRKADKQISVENAQRIAGGSTGTRTRK